VGFGGSGGNQCEDGERARHLERRPGDWRREKATRAHLVIWSESPRNHGINYRVPAPLSL